MRLQKLKKRASRSKLIKKLLIKRRMQSLVPSIRLTKSKKNWRRRRKRPRRMRKLPLRSKRILKKTKMLKLTQRKLPKKRKSSQLTKLWSSKTKRKLPS